MTMTTAIRKDLNGIIVAHKEQSAATVTETGLLKVPGALIIPPSTSGSSDDTHTGSIAKLTASERSAYHLDEIEAQQQQNSRPQPVEQLKSGSRKRRATRAETPETAPATSTPELVHVILPGVGTIPTQYAFMYKGLGVLVLGLNKFSYVPSPAVNDGGVIKGAIEFGGLHGVSYIFGGQEFTDNNGIRCLILIEMPREAEND